MAEIFYDIASSQIIKPNAINPLHHQAFLGSYCDRSGQLHYITDKPLITVTNRLLNPLFINLENWTWLPTQDLTVTVENNSLIFDNYYGSSWLQSFSPISADLGDVLYCRVVVDMENDGASKQITFCTPQIISGVTTNRNDLISTEQAISNKVLSFTYTYIPEAVPTRIAVIGRFDANTNKKKFSISKPLYINLTKDFGPGKEPTKEWCDQNIPFFVGQIKIQGDNQ